MKNVSAAIASVMLAAAVATTAAAQPPAPAATTAPAKLNTADTTIGDLLANPAAKAIVDKHIPGLSDNASISMASGMTLRAIQPMAGDQITEKMLDAIDADLANLPAA